MNTHNAKFFEVLTDRSCYWAGFLAADGYINEKQNYITLTLSEKDKMHICKFKEAMSASHNIGDYDTSNGYRCSTIHIRGANNCIQGLKLIYNITQAKSLTLQPPNLNHENHIRHFIRGYMDGDGSISFDHSKAGHWMLSFIGTEQVLQWIKIQIQSFVSNIGNPSVLPDRNIYQLIFGCEQVKRILDWLYQDSDESIRLQRKYNKYLEVCDFYKHPRQYGSKYTGVNFVKRTGGWTSEIKKNGIRYHLGYFNTEKEAAIAYNEKAKELGLHKRCYVV